MICPTDSHPSGGFPVCDFRLQIEERRKAQGTGRKAKGIEKATALSTPNFMTRHNLAYMPPLAKVPLPVGAFSCNLHFPFVT
jgi:hypothetical protein